MALWLLLVRFRVLAHIHRFIRARVHELHHVGALVLLVGLRGVQRLLDHGLHVYYFFSFAHRLLFALLGLLGPEPGAGVDVMDLEFLAIFRQDLLRLRLIFLRSVLVNGSPVVHEELVRALVQADLGGLVIPHVA